MIRQFHGIGNTETESDVELADDGKSNQGLVWNASRHASSNRYDPGKPVMRQEVVCPFYRGVDCK